MNFYSSFQFQLYSLLAEHISDTKTVLKHKNAEYQVFCNTIEQLSASLQKDLPVEHWVRIKKLLNALDNKTYIGERAIYIQGVMDCLMLLQHQPETAFFNIEPQNPDNFKEEP